MKLNNTINKVIFDLEFADRASHSSLSHDLEVKKEELFQVIDQELSRLEINLTIDQLTLVFPDSGLSTYTEVLEFVRQSIGNALQQKISDPIYTGAVHALTFYQKNGVLPWWLNGGNGFKDRITSFKDISHGDLLKIANNVLSSRNDFHRFKNSLSEGVYMDFISFFLKNGESIKTFKFLSSLASLETVSDFDKVSAEYLLLKNNAFKKSYTQSDLELIANFSSELSYSLIKQLGDSYKQVHIGINADTPVYVIPTVLSFFNDPVTMFVSYLEQNKTGAQLNLSFLEFQITNLDRKKHDELVKTILHHKTLQQEEALKRLLIFHTSFIYDLLDRCLTVKHNLWAAQIFTYFIIHNQFFKRSRNFIDFVKYAMTINTPKSRRDLYEIIVNRYNDTINSKGFFQGFAEPISVAKVDLGFYDYLLSKFKVLPNVDSPSAQKKPPSKGLKAYLIKSARLQVVLQSLEYLNTEKLNLEEKLKTWSSARSQSLPMLLKGLGLRKNQIIEVLIRLWRDLINKKNPSHNDHKILKELRDCLLESAADTSDQKKAKNTIREVLGHELKNSNRNQVKNILLSHNHILSHIDESQFREMLLALNSNAHLLTIYKNVQNAFIQSVQTQLLYDLRDHAARLIIKNDTTYKTRNYAEDLMQVLLKNNASVKEKIIASLTLNTQIIEELKVANDHAMLTLLISLSPQERLKLREKNVQQLKEFLFKKANLEANSSSLNQLNRTANPVIKITDKELNAIWDRHDLFNLNVTNVKDGDFLIDKSNELVAKAAAYSSKKEVEKTINILKNTTNPETQKKLLKFLTDKTTIDNLGRIKEKKWFKSAQEQLPNTDLNELRLQIIEDKNAVGLLRALLDELLKEDREAVLNQASIDLNDRFEYLIQRSDLLKIENVNTATDNYKITIDSISNILTNLPSINIDKLVIVKFANEVIESQIKTLVNEDNLRLLEHWMVQLFGFAFAKSGTNIKEIEPKPEKLLDKHNRSTKQKTKKFVQTIQGIEQESHSLQLSLDNLILDQIEQFYTNRAKQTYGNLYRAITDEISSVKIEGNPESQKLQITESEIQEYLKFLDNNEIPKVMDHLNNFIKDLTISVEYHYLMMVTSRMTNDLPSVKKSSNTRKSLLTNLNTVLKKTDIEALLKQLKSIIPAEILETSTQRILKILNDKKRILIDTQKALLARKISAYLMENMSPELLATTSLGVTYRKNFQDQIKLLQLEQKYGATKAIKLKLIINDLMLKRRTEALKTLRKVLSDHLEHIFENNGESIATITSEDYYKLKPEEIEQLLFATKQNSQDILVPINSILKEERRFIEDEFRQGLRAQIKNLVEKNHPIDQQKLSLRNVDEIISDKKELLSFINTYENHVEVMTLFAKLSLKSPHNKRLQKLWDTMVNSLTSTERSFIELHKKLGISTMTDPIFQQFLRVEVLRSLLLPSSSINAITYNVIEKLKALNLLKPLSKKMIAYKAKSKAAKEIIRAIKLFLEDDEYAFIDRKIETEFYFNDLFYHFLNEGEPPSWAKQNTYTLKDAIDYFNLKVSKRDSNEVIKWMENASIKNKLINNYLKQNIDAQIALLETIEYNTTTRPLSKLFKAVITKSADLQIDINHIFEQVLKEDIYKSRNHHFILEKVIQLTAQGDMDVEQVLVKHFELLKIPTLSLWHDHKGNDFNIQEVVGYYIINTSLPKQLKEETDNVLNFVSAALKNDPLQVINVLKNEVVDNTTIKNLLNLVEKQYLIEGINIAKKKLSNAHQLLVDCAINDLINLNTSSTEFIGHLKGIVFVLNISGRIQKSSYNDFYRIISQINNKSGDKFLARLRNLIDQKIDKLSSENSDRGLKNLESIVKNATLQNVDETEKTLEYYITYGSLPKSSAHVSLATLSDWLRNVLQKEKVTWQIKLHRWTKRKSRINHLLFLFSDDQKGALFSVIHPDLKKDISVIFDEVHELNSKGITWNKSLKTVDEVLHELMTIWSTTFVYNAKNDLILSTFLDRNLNISPVKSVDIEEIIDGKIKASVGNTTRLLKIIKKISSSKLIKIQKQPAEDVDKSNTDLKQGIPISNAGLILAWPFITTLFNKIGLLEKNKFIDDYSQQKGVLLTQYLTNFSDDFHESELALNKLLCGLEISDFVDTTIELSDYEKETSAFLLNAIIHNWDKLSKTSVSTLQETFLQREGIIERFDKDYKLHVSSKAYDLLLKTIPWNISMIQTTFMKNRIIVEWNY